jgi:hypothetical protein
MILQYLDIEDAGKPKDGLYKVMCGHWWIVTQDNKIMYTGSSAQANSNMSIVEHIKNKMYNNCRVEQLPVIYIPITPTEYSYEPF